MSSFVEKLKHKRKDDGPSSLHTVAPAHGISVRTVQADVDAARDAMTHNVAAILNRGENLSELEKTCAHLEFEASQFKKSSHRVRRHMCCRDRRNKLVLIAVCLIVLLLVVGGCVALVVVFLVPRSN
jgi:hypothetical protein